MVDEFFTLFVYGAAVVLVLGWAGCGFAISVSGVWRDRDREIRLEQLGPILWGRCEVPEGLQRYRGVVSFGRVLLKRRDFGEAHLRGLGFNEEQARLVDGNIMVRLRMRLVNDRLVGVLEGTRFQFAPNTAKIVSVTVTSPEDRTWVRSGSAPLETGN